MSDTPVISNSPFGWAGFLVGALSLVLAIALFWAGPFAPQHAVSVSLGELAADIAKSAARSVAGQKQPEPVAPLRTIDDYLQIGVGVLAAVAVILGVAAYVRQENRRAATSGILLGGFAIAFQLFTFTILLIAGTLLAVGVIYALRDAFGDMFGGLLGG